MENEMEYGDYEAQVPNENGDWAENEEYHQDEWDGQPDEYTEWQDYMGGDDWDQGQYGEDY
jgi:hypothetical protein